MPRGPKMFTTQPELFYPEPAGPPPSGFSTIPTSQMSHPLHPQIPPPRRVSVPLTPSPFPGYGPDANIRPPSGPPFSAPPICTALPFSRRLAYPPPPSFAPPGRIGQDEPVPFGVFPQMLCLPLQEGLPVSAPDREQLKIELQQVNQQISQQTRGLEAASNSMLLQREACALASQPAAGVKWSSGGAVSSEQLSLELDHVELEIKKRTREIAMENQVAHEYKLKATENGQTDRKAQLEELSLALGEVSNGSSGMKPASSMGGSMLSLTNKTSSLTLCSADQAASSSDLQKNGVVHSCS
ncbi:hypothetical protein QQF64_014498 [Cirrhinus molitorella]|uniref:Uncharacterized protein n=1 Tax=Cirrhinus molitorella TaxID=172907 RepID=A0ABR3NS98_9TELE